MVKKAKWLENVKKVFGPDVKKLKHQSVEETEISYPVLIARSRSSPPQFEIRVDEVNYEHKKKNLSLPPSKEHSTPSSPESVPPLAAPDRFAGKSKEDASAISIQSTFRGHLARRESQRMRRLARFKSLMEGSVVQKQAGKTLKSMQTLTRVQSQIRSMRIWMSEENDARHKQLLKKHAKDIGGLKNGGNLNVRNQSKKQVEASLLNKCEATMRREKALGYASTHQQQLKSNLKSTNTMFIMDPNNLTWGWSWLERGTADKPLESPEKEQSNTVKPSVKTSHGGQTAKSSNRKKLSSSTQTSTPSTSSSSTTKNPRNNKPTPPSIRLKTTDEITKSRQSIARSSVSDDEGLARRRNMVRPTKPADEIAKCSEKNRSKHITARPSFSDDEGLASSTARRINMVPTKPPRGKLKAQSSAAATKATTEESNGVLPEKAPAKKRASPAPRPRRSSAPPKVENSVLKALKTPCA